MSKNLKRDVIILGLAIVIGLSIRFIIDDRDTIKNFYSTKVYALKVSNFKDFSFEQLKSGIEERDKNIVIYLGQDSCPYCRKNINRIKNIQKIAETNSFLFRHYDLSNVNENEFEYLKSEMNLETVPSLIIINSKTKASSLFGSKELLNKDYKKEFKKLLKGDLKYE